MSMCYKEAYDWSTRSGTNDDDFYGFYDIGSKAGNYLKLLLDLIPQLNERVSPGLLPRIVRFHQRS